MNERTPEFTHQVLQPTMHQKILLRAAEVVALGWTRGTAARDATGQKVRSTAPQATAWCVVGAVDRALYELLHLDVYDLLGLEVDAYDTAPCPFEVLRALRRPLQRVLGRSDLAHWNDHVCPAAASAERLLWEAAASIPRIGGIPHRSEPARAPNPCDRA
jgi:hypothetical protein